MVQKSKHQCNKKYMFRTHRNRAMYCYIVCLKNVQVINSDDKHDAKTQRAILFKKMLTNVFVECRIGNTDAAWNICDDQLRMTCLVACTALSSLAIVSQSFLCCAKVFACIVQCNSISFHRMNTT